MLNLVMEFLPLPIREPQIQPLGRGELAVPEILYALVEDDQRREIGQRCGFVVREVNAQLSQPVIVVERRAKRRC